MEPHPWVYDYYVCTILLTDWPPPPDDSDLVVGAMFANAFDAMWDKMRPEDRHQCEMVSHDLSFSGQYAILSFVFRTPLDQSQHPQP